MFYAVVFGTVTYVPSLEIKNPHLLEGWTDVMGVPYWVLGHALNRGNKWKPHRRDRVYGMGENGLWYGLAEDNEFFIQDNDYAPDQRFLDAQEKYGWMKPVIKRRLPTDRAVYEMAGGEGEVAAYNVGGGGGAGEVRFVAHDNPNGGWVAYQPPVPAVGGRGQVIHRRPQPAVAVAPPREQPLPDDLDL